MLKTVFFTRFWRKNRVFPQIPRIYGSKKTEKNSQKPWYLISVFGDFLVQIPVYGTPPDPKTTKNGDFWSVCLPPPKIIKNRLNFAPSEKFQKSSKNGVFYPKFANFANFQLPVQIWIPPKIIKKSVKFCA